MSRLVFRHGQTFEIHQHTCKVCKKPYEDLIDEAFWCTDCDNEYADWLDEMGLVVGEFDDRMHPNFQPDVHIGTKWEHMND
jgi:hypothetical protein